MDIVERFLTYAQINTQSDENSTTVPSTDRQKEFAKLMAQHLQDIGLQDIEITSGCNVLATLPSNMPADANHTVPTVGFIAHMDTSPDFSGCGVKPRIIANYDGTDITLNTAEGIVMRTTEFPELLRYVGQDIIVTDGTTLLGADDKAGIVAIMNAMETLLAHPERQHGTIRICFTPDEEIGCGADHFEVERFAADFAYTIDGGSIGELEYETFNAAGATVTITGRNVHPGSAYHKMQNSMLVANEFIGMLPQNEIPQETQGYDGFYHLTNMEGTVEQSMLKYIVRDFDRPTFEKRKAEMMRVAAELNARYGTEVVRVEIHDQYYNMREKIEPVMHIVDLAKQAMTDCGIESKVSPIRGGTDGARLSFMGLPTPNIFAGGENFHGKYEFLPIPSLKAAAAVVARIAELAAKG